MGKILVYGGSGAVGSACARRLRAGGFEVHLAGQDQAVLEGVAAELAAEYSVMDVSDPDSLVRTTKEAGPALRGLVYAVGTIDLKSFRRLDRRDFCRDYEVNALGAALAVQAALPSLKRNGPGAAVVLYSSIAARQGLALHASLGMAKGAVEGLVRALAAELAPDIRVNAVAPSLLGDSRLSASLLENPRVRQEIEDSHPLKRLGRSEDIAEATVYLLSDAASWITGQVLGVDGGRSVLR